MEKIELKIDTWFISQEEGYQLSPVRGYRVAEYFFVFNGKQFKDQQSWFHHRQWYLFHLPTRVSVGLVAGAFKTRKAAVERAERLAAVDFVDWSSSDISSMKELDALTIKDLKDYAKGLMPLEEMNIKIMKRKFEEKK